MNKQPAPLGQIIRRFLRETDTSQTSLAERAGVSQSLISRLLSGSVRSVRYPTLQNLARAIEVTPQSLMRMMASVENMDGSADSFLKHSWDNLAWSREVREYLGESLHFFFLAVRPLGLRNIERQIRSLAQAKGIGGLTCYPIFGRFDLLIRVWLHPALGSSFTQLLDDAIPDIRSIRSFRATKSPIDRYSKGENEEGKEALALLSERAVLDIQEGKDPVLKRRLLERDLLLQQDSGELLVQAFVTVLLPDLFSESSSEIGEAIHGYCRDSEDITSCSTHAGTGDQASMLVEFTTPEFFHAGDVALFIAGKFSGARTETSLATDREPLFQELKIGYSTFQELKGRSLIVQGLVPEFYESLRADRLGRAEDIATFVEEELPDLGSFPGLKRIVRAYLRGYLLDDETSMLKALFEYFVALERYLRSAVRKFLAAQGSDASDRSKEMVSKSPTKFLVLGDLLRIYSESIKAGQVEGALGGPPSWLNLARLRNRVLHGDLGLEGGWAEPLRMILLSYPPMNDLVKHVESVTEEKIDSAYFP